MGKPPAPPTAPKPSNPVRETSEDVAFAKEEQRRKQAARRGYQFTMNPTRGTSALAVPAVTPKKTVLG
jgi:hypothetical protein